MGFQCDYLERPAIEPAEIGYMDIAGLGTTDPILFRGLSAGLLTRPDAAGLRIVEIHPARSDGAGGGNGGNNDNFRGGRRWGNGGEHDGLGLPVIVAAFLGTAAVSAGTGYYANQRYYRAHPEDAKHDAAINARITILKRDISHHGGSLARDRQRMLTLSMPGHPNSAHNKAIILQDTTEIHALQAQIPDGNGDLYTSGGVGIGIGASLIIVGALGLLRCRRKRRR